jgi:hypothetical protein
MKKIRLHSALFLSGICDLDPSPRSLALLNGPLTGHESLLPFGRRHMGCPRGAREADGPSSEGLLSATIRPRDTPAKSARFLSPLRVRPSRSRRMPPEPRDATEDLPKERRCQVALGQLQNEVSGVSNEAATSLEQALLQAR